MEETKKVGKISQTAKSVLVSIAAIGGLIGLIFLFVNLSQYKRGNLSKRHFNQMFTIFA